MQIPYEQIKLDLAFTMAFLVEDYEDYVRSISTLTL